MGTHKLSMMLGASAPGSGAREPLDYYATEPAALESFLDQLAKDKIYLESKIWEPACGGGHLSNVLEKRGYSVLSTDIAVRYDGADQCDFLAILPTYKWAGDILTNPPFKHVEGFLRNGLKMVKKGNCVILLQRIMFLESSKRYKLFQEFPPDYRRRLGYTQKQTAKIAGLNMRLYSDIEYGCRPITTRTLFKICKRLKMPLPYEQGIGLLTPPF
jgi:DNA-binding XRE family transcriptional regulator